MGEAVLAIDPSLSSTGFAVIDALTREVYEAARYITKPSMDENERIKNIVLKLYSIYKKYDILNTEVAMEDGFISSANVKTGIQLAKLRGSIITYFTINGIAVATQTPSETRKNLGLKGNAKKEEVAKKIVELYPNIETTVGIYSDKANKMKTSDIYDAICIGNAHLNKKQGC